MRRNSFNAARRFPASRGGGGVLRGVLEDRGEIFRDRGNRGGGPAPAEFIFTLCSEIWCSGIACCSP